MHWVPSLGLTLHVLDSWSSPARPAPRPEGAHSCHCSDMLRGSLAREGQLGHCKPHHSGVISAPPPRSGTILCRIACLTDLNRKTPSTPKTSRNNASRVSSHMRNAAEASYLPRSTSREPRSRARPMTCRIVLHSAVQRCHHLTAADPRHWCAGLHLPLTRRCSAPASPRWWSSAPAGPDGLTGVRHLFAHTSSSTTALSITVRQSDQ